jgi:hypothetical protein
MRQLQEIINENLDRFPEFTDVLVPIRELLDSSASNDTKVDCCKTIIESVAKNVLKYLDPAIGERHLEGMKFAKLCENAIRKVGNGAEDFEIDFTNDLIEPLNNLRNMRNKRGDISHGHIAPKVNSSNEFAELVVQYSEAIAIYVLKGFYSLEGTFSRVVGYDENPDFNEYLDDLYPLEGKPLYSLALYEQYYKDYEIQLSDYLYEQELEE